MLLEPMLSRLRPVRDLGEALQVALRDFVSLHGAEMGDIQLAGHDGLLRIVESLGVSREFLETFRQVSPTSGSACGQAARGGTTVFIPDVGLDPEFAPYRAFAARVPFRSVLSCPLRSPAGDTVGMISALSAQPFAPTALEMQASSAYAGALADVLARLLHGRNTADWVEARSASLLEATPWQWPRLALH